MALSPSGLSRLKVQIKCAPHLLEHQVEVVGEGGYTEYSEYFVYQYGMLVGSAKYASQVARFAGVTEGEVLERTKGIGVGTLSNGMTISRVNQYHHNTASIIKMSCSGKPDIHVRYIYQVLAIMNLKRHHSPEVRSALENSMSLNGYSLTEIPVHKNNIIDVPLETVLARMTPPPAKRSAFQAELKAAMVAERSAQEDAQEASQSKKRAIHPDESVAVAAILSLNRSAF